MTGADVILMLSIDEPDTRLERARRVAQYVDGMSAELERLRRETATLREVIGAIKRGATE